MKPPSLALPVSIALFSRFSSFLFAHSFSLRFCALFAQPPTLDIRLVFSLLSFLDRKLLHPRYSTRSIKGRLKICSQSLFFDPQDESLPVVRYDFRHVSLIEVFLTLCFLFLFSILISNQPWKASSSSFSVADATDTFVISGERLVEMRANNVIEPYRFRKVSNLFTISFPGNFKA